MKEKNRRNIRIFIRVSEIEMQKINRQMEKLRQEGIKTDLSKYMRERAISKNTIIVRDLSEVVKQLLKIGNNINQLTMLAHKGNLKTINLEKFTQELQEAKKYIQKNS